ncbi:MAG: hypothetical protein JWO32_724 [Bacteroidetes bacterium]|nr:hypothetical protein [Bacteroidota bacterium]
MITEKIILFLVNREWAVVSENQNFLEVKPPAAFGLADDFRIHVPKAIDKNDSQSFINNIIEIIAEFYFLTPDDLNIILKNENTIFKIRVYDELTGEGRISLNRFESLIEKIKSILTDTASFVIDKSVTSTRVPEEVSRYINLCNFLQTEKGSFVAKIQLPSKELIKDRELFDREEIYSEEINKKLSDVFSFINTNILEGNAEITDEYIIENEAKINIKLFKDIEVFFEKAKLKNIDFTFHNIENSNTIVNTNVTPAKLHKLTQFVEQIESHTYEVGVISIKGTIITLKSKDPDGLRNSVTFTGLYEEMPVVATANLSSEQYKDAIEAHKLKQYIIITGLAKRTKTRARFVEVTNFEVEE